MPYKCNECGKTFSKARRKVYFGHLKQHSGIRDHICPLCNAAFSSRGYLGNHFKKVHKRKLFEVEKEIQLKNEAALSSGVEPARTVEFYQPGEQLWTQQNGLVVQQQTTYDMGKNTRIVKKDSVLSAVQH